MSISLNAVNGQKYQAICVSAYKEKGFDYMLDFAEKCTKYVPEVILSVIDKFISAEDIAIAEEIAKSIGGTLRVRTFSE